MNLLCCPYCKLLLKFDLVNPINVCPGCSRKFTIRNNVIDFAPDQNFYWGEVEEETMVRLNDQAERDGWFSSFKTHLRQKPTLLNYLLDPVRVAGIFHCYDEDMNETCLDLGSGWGPISFGLSKLYKTVYSLDGVYERLHFQAIRAKQEAINNIVLMKSTMLALPLPDNSVDLVFINGLLEWIGLSNDDKDPQKLQMVFLKEVLRVLRPGGKVMIGIENRFGAQYFLGSKDHSGLRFTSLVPRWLASIIVRYVRRGRGTLVFSGAEKNYRTLTYSYWGYQSLLAKAGFIRPELYWTWPSYNYPRVSGINDGLSVRRYLVNVANMMDEPSKRIFLKILLYLPDELLSLLIKIFSPHFLITSGKSFPTKSIQDAILGGGTNKPSFLRLTQGIRADLRTTYIKLRNNSVEKIYHVVENYEKDGGAFKITEQKVIAGDPIKPYKRNHVRLATQWLVDYQRSTQSGIWDSASLTTEIETLYHHLKSIAENKELLCSLDQYINHYKGYIQVNPLLIVSEHGDYTPLNILLDGKKIIPVDWEFEQKYGHPFMDIGGFSLSLLRRARGVKNFNPGEPIYEYEQFYKQLTNRTIFLSPVYYILRIISRWVKANGLKPITHIYVQECIKYLPEALEFGKLDSEYV